MNEYYDGEVYHDEDDFWSDISTEEDFPWDENPDNSEDKTERKTIHVVYVEPGELIRLCYNKELYELPRRMQGVLRTRSRGLLGDVRTNVLASFLDHDDFIVRCVDERGMVTAGGVSLDEIDMRTMRVKRFDGLYVIGEALDADGITGGYNLQLCWSTAATAADDLRGSDRD